MITVVSGLPRSGTSLMMQMLQAGGMSILADAGRPADEHNPKGYLEYQKVRSLKSDNSWIADAEGRVVKVVSQLLYHLPPAHEYRIIFMQRDLDEVLRSQEKMLAGLQQPSGPERDMMRQHFTRHLAALDEWLGTQAHFSRFECNFSDLITKPAAAVQEIVRFLGIPLNVQSMAEAVDPILYRQRNN